MCYPRWMGHKATSRFCLLKEAPLPIFECTVQIGKTTVYIILHLSLLCVDYLGYDWSFSAVIVVCICTALH
jgi:hypothetical protein